jgi:hypothetical protein
VKDCAGFDLLIALGGMWLIAVAKATCFVSLLVGGLAAV